MTNYTGRRLGHYHLHEQIGSGGYADVYKAYDVLLDREVAVKVLKARVDPRDFEAVYLHALEARTLARLRHPHIVNVIDFNIQSTTAYIVMDYAKNGSLKDIHPIGERLEWDTILHYLEQITEALAFIHEHHFVHQDVKPANILLDDNYEIVVSDFGTAAFIQHSESQIMPEFIGTIRYAAPERFTNEIPTPASDIYSLAALVFEWYTGEPLFTGSTPQIIRQHRFIPPSTRRMSALGIAPSIQRVLLKALAKNPRRRYENATAFYKALIRAVRETNEHLCRWAEMAFISVIDGLISFLADVVVGLVGIEHTIYLPICQLCLILVPMLVALTRKNWIALWFFLGSSLVATLIGLLFRSWLVFYFALPCSLLVSAFIGFLRGHSSWLSKFGNPT